MRRFEGREGGAWKIREVWKERDDFPRKEKGVENSGRSGKKEMIS